MVVSGRSAESKEFQLYTPPSLEELINKAKNIRSEYHGKNTDRLELITLLEVVHNFIEQRLAKDTISKNDYHNICMGSWIFAIEKIALGYSLLNPHFEFGSLFNSGSKLYKLLLNQLNIDKTHQINNQSKLSYLNKFHNYIFKADLDGDPTLISNELTLLEEINAKRLKPNLKEQLIQVMQEVLRRENHAEKRVLKAIPYERSIDNKISQFYVDYKRKSRKPNPSRLFLIRLAIAISKSNSPVDDRGEMSLGRFLSRTQRVKMGILIYIMQSIADSYKIRSPNNSVLYDLCDDALVNCFKYLNDSTKMACLSAFYSYINDENNRSVLEKEMNKQILEQEHYLKYMFIDPDLNLICKNVINMMKNMLPTTGVSKVTKAMTGLGAIIGTAPGYGAGYGVGFGFSMTDQVNLYKNQVSGFTRSAMAVIFEGGEYFGYYSADILINATLERFFAKIFEALGALTCAAGFGMMSFIIYDLSYQTACNLCQLYLHLSKNVNPSLLSHTDLNFVNTLLELPKSVFSDSKKEQLRSITDNSARVSELGLLAQRISPEEKQIIDANSHSLLMIASPTNNRIP